MGFTLGLGGPYFHDSSACLVDERGALVAFVEEERLTRRKHNAGSRSCTLSAAWCLDEAGISFRDVDEVAIGWNPRFPEARPHIEDRQLMRTLLDPRWFAADWPDRVTVVEHHLAHAASAFYLSGCADAAVLVVDGAGDGKATSIYHGNARGLREVAHFSYTQSLGWFYEAVGEFLGLGDGTGSAGKLMGLAAYGAPRVPLDFMRTCPGGYWIDLSKYGLPPRPEAAPEAEDPAYFGQLKRAYNEAFAATGVTPIPRERQPHSPHQPGLANVFRQEQADLAASAQGALEDALLELCRRALRETHSLDLCLAGGVAFNCSANGVLHRRSGARSLFVQPVAGDAGCAIGAALEAVRRRGRLAWPLAVPFSAGLGPGYPEADIAAALRHAGVAHLELGDAISERVAGILSSGRTVGWFQGRAEAGPRALGHRSILADPRSAGRRDRINRDVKQRERWRPFAPSIAEHARREFLVDPPPAMYMNVACSATPHARANIPATVHADGSVRPQVVPADGQAVHPRFGELLRAFERETGVAALLNTSFNAGGEPMVCSPFDALRTFFSTPLDALAIGGFLVTK